MSRFDIRLSATEKISGEYKAGRHVVVFSHGFDVRRDSNGLFHDIAANLPKDFGYVLFDYHSYEGSTETLRTFHEQARVLGHVIAWVKTQLHPLSFHLIAHSMGCVTAAFAGYSGFETVTFLAPPMKNTRGLRHFFTTHPGATHYGDYWEISRKSGKTTRVSERFFRELESANPSGFIRAYAFSNPIKIICATADQFIPEQHYDILKSQKNISVHALNADHNFTGEARHELLATLALQFTARARSA